MTWKIKATNPPSLRKEYATKVAWALAGVMVLMAVAHLIRIDKLIPVVEQTLSGSSATWFVALVVTSEVFAVPYLLRMKLSPGFRIVSGALAVLVPLVWTCFTIWAQGEGHSTGQFSSYVSAPASWWLVLLNCVWLGVSYWLLWLSNYDAAFTELKRKAKS